MIYKRKSEYDNTKKLFINFLGKQWFGIIFFHLIWHTLTIIHGTPDLIPINNLVTWAIPSDSKEFFHKGREAKQWNIVSLLSWSVFGIICIPPKQFKDTNTLKHYKLVWSFQARFQSKSECKNHPTPFPFAYSQKCKTAKMQKLPLPPPFAPFLSSTRSPSNFSKTTLSFWS